MKLFLKKLLFPFKKDGFNLGARWWHRLLMVILFLGIILIFIFCLIIFPYIIPENSTNTSKIINLLDFTKSIASGNSIPAFINLGNKFACFKDNKINNLYTGAVEKNYCSNNIPSEIDDATNYLIRKNNLSNEDYPQLKSLLEQRLKEVPDRKCFLKNDLGECSSENIFNYKTNYIFYLEVLIASLGFTYLIYLLLRLIYYYGIIYIIFGK